LGKNCKNLVPHIITYSMNKFFRLALFGAALLMLCGFSPPAEPTFEGTSEDVIFPSFNVNYSLLTPEEMRVWRLSIELEGSGGRGDDVDSTGGTNGDPILNGAVFPRWEDVKMRYSINNYMAIVRGGLWVKGRAGFELFAGVGRIDLSLKAYFQDIYGYIRKSQYVIVSGAHITAPFPGPFNFYFRGMRLENRYDVSLLTAETGLNYPFSKNLNIYAGLRRWDYDYEGNRLRSDIRLNLSGYAAGLRLAF